MAKKTLIETEDQRFVRDPSNMALINNDVAAYAQYRERRKQGNKVNDLCDELDGLKQDMADIKQMLINLGQADGK